MPDKTPSTTEKEHRSVVDERPMSESDPRHDNTKGSSKQRVEKKSQSKRNNKPKAGPDSKDEKPATFLPTIPPNTPQQTSDINYGQGREITVLHVAEKPSIGQAIAVGLCKGSPRYRSGKGLPVHEFSDPAFPKAPKAKSCLHRVTSVAGHVFSVDFPQEFQSWDSVDPAELFDAPIKRKPTKGSVVKHLQDEARGVDFIVLWMDCDREGENINFEVLDCCMHLMKSGGGNSNYDRVYRAHFSAINASDILKAYHALGKPDKNQSLSVDARQELDLKVGVAFSRFQTRFFQGRYGDLDSSVLSYGPCQTPTLGFCVQRHIDIETFTPEPYYVLELGISKRGRSLRALWDSGRSFTRKKVEDLRAKAIEEDRFAVVSSVVMRDKKQGRPVPLNTVALLKACSKALGIGPHAAMQTAERLYLSGYLSYPRTESTAYPKSFDVTGALKEQASDNRWGEYVRGLLRDGPNKSRGGVDMGDHPPITPCRSARSGELSGDMARVYDLVVRHFIASVSPDAVWRSTCVVFCLPSLESKGTFTLRGKEPVSPGFLSVLLHKEYGDDRGLDNGDEDEEERSIPEFVEGEKVPLMNALEGGESQKVTVAVAGNARATLHLKEKMTSAPGYLTESELIGMMEKHGIGTDASIPTHIENIQKRNYVYLESGRKLHPNKLGMVLVQGYHQIDSTLVLPQIRADIEGECNKIAKGLATKEQVVKNAIRLFKEKYNVFVGKIDKMDVLFGSSFSKLQDVGKAFTRCGRTRRYLTLIEGPPLRLYNKWTETVYPMPAGGVVKAWSGRSCSVEGCNFELCMYSVGQPPRSFPLCPRCFNDPSWALESETMTLDESELYDEGREREKKRMAGKMLTLECPLPDSHPLIDELTVSPDPDSDGVLTVDVHFGPNWRFVSTRSPTIVHLPKSILSLTVLNSRDSTCHRLRDVLPSILLTLHVREYRYTYDSSRIQERSIALAERGPEAYHLLSYRRDPAV